MLSDLTKKLYRNYQSNRHYESNKKPNCQTKSAIVEWWKWIWVRISTNRLVQHENSRWEHVNSCHRIDISGCSSSNKGQSAIRFSLWACDLKLLWLPLLSSVPNSRRSLSGSGFSCEHIVMFIWGHSQFVSHAIACCTRMTILYIEVLSSFMMAAEGESDTKSTCRKWNRFDVWWTGHLTMRRVMTSSTPAPQGPLFSGHPILTNILLHRQ